MGINPRAAPVTIINAVIDLELAPRPAGVRTSEDIIES
jgi:hypothetical protein